MKTHSTTDVEALARGHMIHPAAFQSIFADDDAVAELARLLQVNEALSPPRDEADAGVVVEMECSFEDLALFGEDRLRDSRRRQAVHDFLNKHGLLVPQGAPDAPTKDDTIRGAGDTETINEPGKPIPPQS